MEYNSISTLNILEHLRRNNRDAKVIYASSRMVYGKINTPKVDEFHPTNPLSLYAVHKLTSEKYLQMYANDFDISTTSLRITNPYGPRQQIKHNKYSLVGWFIKEAMDNHEINIYGDGDQYRDYIFIDDIVDGLVAVGLCTKCAGEVYNLGYGESVMFKDMVHMIVDIVGSGKIKHIKWPEDYELVETGHFKVCVGKLSTLIDWKPKYSLHEGIIKTYEYYKEYRDNYSYVRNFL